VGRAGLKKMQRYTNVNGPLGPCDFCIGSRERWGCWPIKTFSCLSLCGGYTFAFDALMARSLKAPHKWYCEVGANSFKTMMSICLQWYNNMIVWIGPIALVQKGPKFERGEVDDVGKRLMAKLKKGQMFWCFKSDQSIDASNDFDGSMVEWHERGWWLLFTMVQQP